MYEIEVAGASKPVLYLDNITGRNIGGANAIVIPPNFAVETSLASFLHGFIIMRDSDKDCMQACQDLASYGGF